MCAGACPAPDVLCQFLDEHLEPDSQAEIGSHVDLCVSCQTTLETLTRRRASDLFGMDTEFLDGLSGLDGVDQDRTDEPDGIDADAESADSPSQTDTDPGPSDRLEESAATDPDRTETYASPGGSGTDPGSSVSFAQAGAFKLMDRTEFDDKYQLPQLAAYELLELLGEGGMGVVYKARQRGLNRLVAVKMIRADRRSSADRLARFRNEAEAVARLRHPNIVQIFEIGTAAGAPFVSLELLEGGSLDQKLAGTPQPGRSAAELVITVARAVQVAHDAGIIHRDLKPSNILFTGDGIPKITDFGLAKRLESDSGQTESGQIMGSPSYMAPEQAGGRTRNVGPAADVYALGAVLYEMLTGRPPFKGETPVETLHQVIGDEVVPPSRLVSKVSRDLETICLHCLKKDQSRRYGSAGALAEDIERFLTGRPIQARRTPFWERGLKLARRHPVAATLTSLAVLATIGLAAAWIAIRARETQRVEGLTSFAIQTLFKAQDDINQKRWGQAEPALTALQEKIRGVRDLGELARRTEGLLAKAKVGRASAETQGRHRDQLTTFRQRRKDALLHETHFTGLGLPYEPEAIKSSARKVLEVFAAQGDKGVPEVGPSPDTLTEREQKEIKDASFEMLLILADAEKSAERSLELLDQAGRLRAPTRAYLERRADCLARRGDAHAAQELRKKAETLTVDSALDRYLLGKSLYRQGDYSAALPHLDAALQLDPAHFWAHCLSAVCRMQLGHAFQAKTELTACLQIEPLLPWLYELRGFASYQIAVLAGAAAESVQATGKTLKSEYEAQLHAAESDYASAFDLLASAPSKELRYGLLVNRGLLWLERREWEKAVADLQEAIKLDDRQWPAFETLAKVYERQDKPDQAIEQFTRAIELRPNSAPLYRARAAVNRGRKDPGPAHRVQALADLEKAIGLDPQASAVLAQDQAHRARLLLQGGRHEEALAACDAALLTDRGHREAHLIRVEVLRKLNRYDDVIRSCDALLARGKPSAELYEFRALAREKINDYPRAIEDYTLAIGVRPAAAEIWARRGVLYLATDAPRPALRDFDEAIRLDSTNADAYVGRGLALAALRRHRDAVADADKSVTLGEPTAKRLYSAARIYALSAPIAAAEVGVDGRSARSLATAYQNMAVRLIGRAVRRELPEKRATFLRDIIQPDPAFSAIRRRLNFEDYRALHNEGNPWP
jgi:serine/threonine protein kinase/tetratricopeptide (TPR) repeat protein